MMTFEEHWDLFPDYIKESNHTPHVAIETWYEAHKHGYKEAIKDCLAAGSMGAIEKLARQEGIDNGI